MPKEPESSKDSSGTKKLKVGIVFDEGGRGDKSFNDSAWEGIQKAEKDFSVDVKVVDSKFAKDYETNQNALAEQGMDIVFVVGGTQQDALKRVATNNPDTKFALVDGSLDMKNVRNLNFTEEQGSFLAGYLAGLVTKSGKIGFVGGMSVPLIKKFECGYIAGAKTSNPNVQVLPAKYTESWSDVSQGKAAAALLFGQGADIVYHAAGRCGLGVIDAAKDAGKYAIGVDGNQDDIAPGHVLTSMVKHVDIAVYDTIKDIKEGKFEGGTIVYNLAENGVGLTDFAHTKQAIGQDNIDKVEAVKATVIAGDIKVPTTQAELESYLAAQ
jgi:basic membrane protein A